MEEKVICPLIEDVYKRQAVYHSPTKVIRLGNIALISTSLSPQKALFPLNLAAQLFHSIDSFIGGTMQSVVLSAYSS